jgi:transposase InsO family protein
LSRQAFEGNLAWQQPEIREAVRDDECNQQGWITGVLASNGITISMDGKGAGHDNVFVERLWRSVKYEEFIYEPTTASATPAPHSADIW